MMDGSGETAVAANGGVGRHFISGVPAQAGPGRRSSTPIKVRTSLVATKPTRDVPILRRHGDFAELRVSDDYLQLFDSPRM